jgi:DNA-binding NarL/FixJ family response regulator
MLPALIIDGNGTVIECGNLEPFDYLSGDITGGHISRIAIEAETFLRSLPSAAGDSDGCSAEIELKKKNGERVLASAGVSLIAGAPGRYLVILTDIRFTKDILSARELEIVACMRRGLLVKTIAAELNISENTVNTHIKNMFRKTGIRNKKDLLRKLSED